MVNELIELIVRVTRESRCLHERCNGHRALRHRHGERGGGAGHLLRVRGRASDSGLMRDLRSQRAVQTICRGPNVNVCWLSQSARGSALRRTETRTARHVVRDVQRLILPR